MRAVIFTTALLLTACGSMNAPIGDQESRWPIVYQQKFLRQHALADFAFTDAARWRWHQQGEEHGLTLLGGSQYKPTHRSPTSIALIKDVEVLDFDQWKIRIVDVSNSKETKVRPPRTRIPMSDSNRKENYRPQSLEMKKKTVSIILLFQSRAA